MPVRITEADLRKAMRDARYWQAGHPERAAFSTWVTDGYRALHPSDAAPRASVWVRAYTRNGHAVAAHWRSAPATQGTDDRPEDGPQYSGSGGDAPEVVQANAVRRLLQLFRRGPADGRGSGGPPTGGRTAPERRRWPGRDGRDRVEDMRSDPATVRLRDAHSAGTAQYRRPGGAAGRQRDLEALNPVGQPERIREGVSRYSLADGRVAVVRDATHPTSSGEPTLEIAELIGNGRYRPTDIFRYPPSR